MKIRIIPKSDGKADVWFQQTRAKEEKGAFLKDVAMDSLRTVVGNQVRRMRGEPAGPVPEGS